jgi:hypothetical protein
VAISGDDGEWSIADVCIFDHELQKALYEKV